MAFHFSARNLYQKLWRLIVIEILIKIQFLSNEVPRGQTDVVASWIMPEGREMWGNHYAETVPSFPTHAYYIFSKSNKKHRLQHVP